jgi:membrane protease YdiL (CAAX protease family)
MIRGIIFRIIEEELSSYLALIISALIFGTLHLLNLHATIIFAACVAAEARLLFGAAYIYSRSLWLPIAIHFALNFVQSRIFGAATSGNDSSPGLLTTSFSGQEWISGGKFGPEGFIQATIFCLIAAGIFMYLNIKDGKLIPYQV